MGFVFRKSKSLGGGRRINVSGSGVSMTQKLGPVSINSRGRVSVRILPGLSFRLPTRRR